MGRGIIAVAFAGALSTSCTFAALAKDGSTQDVSKAALRYFESVPGGDFEGFLRRIRPAPLAPVLRARVMSSLPRNGELRPTARDAAKLNRIHPVLAFHGQQDEIEFRLVEAGGRVGLGLYARTVLVIPTAALDQLEPDELQALVAHEIGHLYFWDEYEEARNRIGNRIFNRRLQELELRCDGVSVVTMHRLGVDPDRLVSAIVRLTRFNERSGSVDESNYVALPERVRFIRAIAALVAERASQKPFTCSNLDRVAGTPTLVPLCESQRPLW